MAGTTLCHWLSFMTGELLFSPGAIAICNACCALQHTVASDVCRRRVMHVCHHAHSWPVFRHCYLCRQRHAAHQLKHVSAACTLWGGSQPSALRAGGRAQV